MSVSTRAEQKPASLAGLIAELGAELVHDCVVNQAELSLAPTNFDALLIQGVAALDDAKVGDISFVAQDKFAAKIKSTQASYLIVSPSLQDQIYEAFARPDSALQAVIFSSKPYLCFAKLTQWWRRLSHGASKKGAVHPSAVVDESAQVHPSAYIGPLCVVEAGASIGAHTVLKSRVTLAERCVVGHHCIVHSGVVIGSDGFGFANHVGNGLQPGGAWEKIEQLGRVVIGNHVEIGANVCIDRGALSDTIIEDGVKLDNLIHIAHGVRLGRHTAVAASAIFAGGVQVGAHCTFGGAARVKGHVHIADNVHISADTNVIGDVPQAGQYTGMFPMLPHKEWMKNAALIGQLSALRKRIQDLEKMNAK